MKTALKVILTIVAVVAFLGLTAEAVNPANQLPLSLACMGILFGSAKGLEKLMDNEK